ncbi:glycosyltransferase family 2 protein, partial [Campylobacter jejuni]|nr:glycosyltransferase family 2 protein [Campylobacter jejuni]
CLNFKNNDFHKKLFEVLEKEEFDLQRRVDEARN